MDAEIPGRTPTVAELITQLDNPPAGSPGLDYGMLDYAIFRRVHQHAVNWLESHPPGAVPRYTASVDDALTLVPDGMWWTVAAGQCSADEPLFGASIYRADFTISPPVASGEHPTSAAIALCIAALKARATSEAPRTPDTSVEPR